MLIRWIKKLFGIYETGYEYWVHTDQIIITPDFAHTRIGTKKMDKKAKLLYENRKIRKPDCIN